LTDATSKDRRGAVCAKAIQRGVSEPASTKAPSTTALAATPPADTRGENVRPQRSIPSAAWIRAVEMSAAANMAKTRCNIQLTLPSYTYGRGQSWQVSTGSRQI